MEMTIIFYDVEHGSCTHIMTPNNKHILVDIGSKTCKSITSYIWNRYFGHYGGNIDELIITHPHEDHIYDSRCIFSHKKCIEDDGKSNKKTDKIVESQVF